MLMASCLPTTVGKKRYLGCLRLLLFLCNLLSYSYFILGALASKVDECSLCNNQFSFYHFRDESKDDHLLS